MTAILVLLMCAAAGQVPATEQNRPEVREHVPDYQLGPGDVLSIQVSGVRAFEQSTRVSNSGRIRVAYVGIMFVGGLTVSEVEREIARLIKEHELINEPSVMVQVQEYRARPTYVIGEVNAPGQFVISGEMYLLDLLSKAGGLMPSAGETAFLYRRNSPQPVIEARLITEGDGSARPPGAPPEFAPRQEQDFKPEEVIRINLNQLAEGTQPDVNVRLRGGDILYVPRARPRNIYVIGDVKIPGAYQLPRRGEITAAQAVIYAGGPLATAKMGHGFLMRHDAAGVRQAIPVDFTAIIKGRSPDIPVRADDIIFIPSSAIKTVTVGLLNMLPQLINQFVIF